MNKEVLKERFTKWRKVLLNKYVITLTLFAVVLIFVGNQSLVSRIGYASDIRQKKAELRDYQNKISQTRSDIQSLDNPDSLERYAREHYLMHADNEDVYIIKE